MNSCTRMLPIASPPGRCSGPEPAPERHGLPRDRIEARSSAARDGHEPDRPSVPHWVGFVCDDLERQRRFYSDTLGLRETDRGDAWVQFDLGTGVTFGIIARSDDPEYDRPRYRVGFVVDDILGARQALLGGDVQPVSDVKGATSRCAYFRDPQGSVFEITERR